MAESGDEDRAGWDEACRREAAIPDLLNRYPSASGLTTSCATRAPAPTARHPAAAHEHSHPGVGRGKPGGA
jgi:hypothetical protein